MRLVLALALVSCGGAPTVVVDEAGATLAIGTQVEVRGTAQATKLAPSVVTERGLVVYCLGLSDWPAGTRSVVVRGKLDHTDEFTPKGPEIAAGTSGPVYVLRDCAVQTR